MNEVIAERRLTSGQRLQVVLGDLTEEAVDAIVNAANSHLQHGGGVAAAISRKGGPEIQAQSNAWVREHGPVKHAEPAYTGAGRLPCRYVIHAVGPVWGEGNEDEKLKAAVAGSLRLAETLNLTSIALPAISTGIFGFPKERAASAILAAILDHFRDNPASLLEVVRLTLFDRHLVEVFLNALGEKESGETN